MTETFKFKQNLSVMLAKSLWLSLLVAITLLFAGIFLNPLFTTLSLALNVSSVPLRVFQYLLLKNIANEEKQIQAVQLEEEQAQLKAEKEALRIISEKELNEYLIPIYTQEQQDIQTLNKMYAKY